MKTYSITQVRQLLNVDNKTLSRWLEKAGITPQGSQHDERVKRISREQLERLACIHERPIGALPVEKEVHPTVKALERKITDQGKELAQLKADLETQATESTNRLESVTLRYEELIGVLEGHITEQGELLAQLNAVFHAFMRKTEQELYDLREVHIGELRERIESLEREREVSGNALAKAYEQLAHMAERIDALEARLETRTPTRATPRPSRPAESRPTPAPDRTQASSAAPHRIPIESLDELPPDAIPYHEFVKALQGEGFNINARGFRDRVDAEFEHYGYYHEARKEWKRYFTPEQQETIRKALL